jgi:hypothetical protein
MTARCLCLASSATSSVPPFRKIRKLSLGCDAFFQFWNPNGKSHETVITQLEQVRTSAIWLVELFTGYPILLPPSRFAFECRRSRRSHRSIPMMPASAQFARHLRLKGAEITTLWHQLNRHRTVIKRQKERIQDVRQQLLQSTASSHA